MSLQTSDPALVIATGWYRTRGGRAAYVTCLEQHVPGEFGVNRYPVVGRLQGHLEPQRWQHDGRFDEGGPHEHDLIRRTSLPDALPNERNPDAGP